MISWLNRMGEGLYSHETPDGYPLTAAAWTGPGQMDDALRDRAPDRRRSGRPVPAADAPARRVAHDATPAQPSASSLQTGPLLLRNAFSSRLGAEAAAGDGHGARRRRRSPQDWNTLFLSSPEFMRR